MNALLDLETAQEIADEFGYREDITPDVELANSCADRNDPEKLFRGYMDDYTSEWRSNHAMLSRTGFGLIER